MNQIPEKTSHNRLHINYLDGLRGLASVYVVFSHIWELQEDNLPSAWLKFSNIFRYGTYSVCIFIVLSGYCLMLPVVRSHTRYISGSLLDYFKRRSRRILPPYYAALILSVLVGIAITILVNTHVLPWDDKLWGHFEHKFSFVDAISHFLLIHNLIPGDTAYSINGPMWSVATEWQIYFLFPLILLPIWHRFGGVLVVVVAFILGLAPHYFLNGLIDKAHPWFLGLFALGMAAADIGFSQTQFLIKMRKLLPWGLLSIIFACIALFTEWRKFGLEIWISEGFAGLATACLLIYCTNCVIAGKTKPLVLRIFQSPWAVAVGSFSYSLYLLHVVVLTPLNQYLHSSQLTPVNQDIILYTVTFPVSLLVAYLFYLVFERPFMSSFLQKRKIKDAIKKDKS